MRVSNCKDPLQLYVKEMDHGLGRRHLVQVSKYDTQKYHVVYLSPNNIESMLSLQRFFVTWKVLQIYQLVKSVLKKKKRFNYSGSSLWIYMFYSRSAYAQVFNYRRHYKIIGADPITLQDYGHAFEQNLLFIKCINPVTK